MNTVSLWQDLGFSPVRIQGQNKAITVWFVSDLGSPCPLWFCRSLVLRILPEYFNNFDYFQLEPRIQHGLKVLQVHIISKNGDKHGCSSASVWEQDILDVGQDGSDALTCNLYPRNSICTDSFSIIHISALRTKLFLRENCLGN